MRNFQTAVGRSGSTNEKPVLYAGKVMAGAGRTNQTNALRAAANALSLERRQLVTEETIKIRGLELLTTRQAATELSVTTRRIQQLCADGLLGIRIGRSYMIARQELDQFSKKSRKPGRPKKEFKNEM